MYIYCNSGGANPNCTDGLTFDTWFMLEAELIHGHLWTAAVGVFAVLIPEHIHQRYSVT